MCVLKMTKLLINQLLQIFSNDIKNSEDLDSKSQKVHATCFEPKHHLYIVVFVPSSILGKRFHECSS